MWDYINVLVVRSSETNVVFNVFKRGDMGQVEQQQRRGGWRGVGE